MNQHEFDSTSEAYDNTQCNEEVKTGDIIIIKSEKVIGISDTWPIAITVKHGELHTPSNTISYSELSETLNNSAKRYNKDVDFKQSFKEAVKVANELGFEVNGFFKT